MLALTGSPLLAGAVGTAASLSGFAVRLPAGALADRLDRRRMMVLVDGGRVLALGLLAALVLTHSVSWPVVMAVAIVDRAGDTLFTPASIAALPLIVPDEQLEAAWAVSEGRQYAANLVGPPLGGLLYGIGRAVPFIADAVSYGVSVLTSRGLRGEFSVPPAEGERRGLWAEAFEGLQALWRDKLLRAVLIQAPLINFAVGGAIFTVILGLRRNGSSALVIGGAEAVIMTGGIVGAFVAPWIRARVSIRQAILLITLSEAVMTFAAAGIMPSPAVAVPLAIPLIVAPASNAVLFALVLRRTAPAMHGRVNNGLLQIATALATLAPLISGAVVDQASARWAMALFAASLLPVLPMALFFPAQDAPAEPS